MMLLAEIKQIKSEKSDLKSFGMTLGSAFLIFAGLIFLLRHSVLMPLLLAACFFYFLAFVFPIFLKPIQKVWMTIALLMGWVMTRVILCAVFYGVLTPIAFVLRLTGTRFMDLGFDRNRKTYWLAAEGTAYSRQSSERQF